MTNDNATIPDNDDFEDYDTYSEMLRAYLKAQRAWIGSTELPLVHHLRRLAKQLDSDDVKQTAALSSAYLQAFTRLDKRRPGAAVTGDPDQTDIFEFLD